MVGPRGAKGSVGRGLALGGVVAFGVACCASAPLLLGLVASIAAGGALGVGAGGLFVGAVVAMVVWRLRRRRSCPVGPVAHDEGRSPSGRPTRAVADHPSVEVTP